MALATVNIPNANRQPGVATIPQTVVPAGATSVRVDLATADWTDPATTITLSLETSDDGGTTWVGGGGVTGWGPDADGLFRNANGALVTTTSAFFSWAPNVTHLRGTLEFIGGAIKTGGTVTVN